MNTVPTPDAAERLAQLCADLLVLAEQPETPYEVARSLQRLAEAAHGEPGEEPWPFLPDDPADTAKLARLGRHVASHVLDAMNAASFGDALAERVAERVNDDLEMLTLQGWWAEFVFPAWSGYCWVGDHEQCNGTAPPSETGCHCTICNHHGPGQTAVVPGPRPGGEQR